MIYKSKHKLFKKQVDFVTSESRYTLYSGAVRGGKTLALCYRALALAKPGAIILIACHTYKMLSRVILPVFMQVLQGFPPSRWKYEKSDQKLIIKVAGGESIISLSHLQDPYSIQGMTLSHYLLDEATAGVSEDTFLMLNSRLSNEYGTGAIATNPGPLSHYLYQFFYECDDSQKYNRTVIEAKTVDNKTLPKDYIDDLLTRPKSWIMRYMEGKWGLLGGVIYDEFDRGIHTGDFEHEPTWEYGLAIDYGFVNPFACLVIATDYDGRFYVVDEYYKTKTLIEDHAEYIKDNLLNKYSIKSMISDNANPESRIQLENKLDLRSDFALNFKRVIPGLNAVKSAMVVQQDGSPRLMIHPRCENLIREIESYKWRIDRQGVVLEEPEKKDDHGCDALRYFIKSREN